MFMTKVYMVNNSNII